jgi:hypothetical protein
MKSNVDCALLALADDGHVGAGNRKSTCDGIRLSPKASSRCGNDLDARHRVFGSRPDSRTRW